VRTRWNSTYDMLERAVKYKDIISDTIYAHKDRSLINLLLDENDWKCMDDLLSVLRPLKEATLITSENSESLCVFNVIPLYYYCTESLKQSLLKFKSDDDIYIGIEAAIEKLTYYYDKISPMVGITLILEPTLKKQYLTNCLGWKQQWVKDVLDHFNEAFSYYKERPCQVSISQQCLPETTPKKAIMFGYKNFKRQKLANQDVNNNEEEFIRYIKLYNRYLNAPLAEDGTNLLAFWKSNSFHYPVLSTMAKDYLTVQASSVPSERAFSSGADLVTADRCSLGGETVEITTFLKFNL
jgi:hypothetical protein